MTREKSRDPPEMASALASTSLCRVASGSGLAGLQDTSSTARVRVHAVAPTLSPRVSSHVTGATLPSNLAAIAGAGGALKGRASCREA